MVQTYTEQMSLQRSRNYCHRENNHPIEPNSNDINQLMMSKSFIFHRKLNQNKKLKSQKAQEVEQGGVVSHNILKPEGLKTYVFCLLVEGVCG